MQGRLSSEVVIYSEQQNEKRFEKGGRETTMLTQIEIDGFKTFKDFKVELAPFHLIHTVN
jgi:hypothetical protein